MKMALTICLLFVTGILFSQDRLLAGPATADNPAFANSTPSSSAGKPVSTKDITDPGTLSRILTEPYNTEKEKVRSIFLWITDNISYYRMNSRLSSTRKGKAIANDPGNYQDYADTGPLKPLTERIAIQVLQQRRTYCDGYARLFKSLCDHASIRSEIITGYARSDINTSGEKFSSNHSWNAVYFDSSWHLLDVTWASGYSTRSGDNFVKKFDDYYWMTPPGQFIRHHYPDDLRWTLLKNPPPLFEFRYSPFHQRSFIKYDIRDYYPSRGIIDARVGDTIHLVLETGNASWSRSVTPDSLWDSTTLVYTPDYKYVQPDGPARGNRVSYSFPVDSESVEWLHIMYNNDAVLRYKLNVKKTNSD
jgi:hypothetical protein